MKKKITLLGVLMFFVGTSIAQIIPAVNGETSITGPVVNTGIAIGPYYHWQALVYDDPSLTSYRIEWRDDMGNFLDGDSGPGFNPDVAYYANVDACVVAYEDGGNIFVDDYYLNTLSPVDYVLNTANYVSNGTNPNVDINSPGNGVLCWEDGGNVFACTFNIGTFTAGPVVWIGNGAEPDIVLLDNDNDIVITYTQAGQLMVETYDHASMMGGFAALMSSSIFSPMGVYETPRIASQRNSIFSPVSFYTVVAQDNLGSNYYNVDGFFESGGGVSGPVLINTAVNNCGNLAPKPVVTYNLGRVDIAWAQRYAQSCAGAAFPPSGERDILMATCGYAGTNSYGFSTFLEVNQVQLNFLASATSLNSEYDGNYSVDWTNYNEGIFFNYPNKAFWKKRDPAVPSFRVGESTELATIVKAPGDTKIEVTMNIDMEEQMTFVLYDNSGRIIEIPTLNEDGSSYTLDASQLKNGIYILNCIAGDQTTIARIPHFAN